MRPAFLFVIQDASRLLLQRQQRLQRQLRQHLFLRGLCWPLTLYSDYFCTSGWQTTQFNIILTGLLLCFNYYFFMTYHLNQSYNGEKKITFFYTMSSSKVKQ